MAKKPKPATSSNSKAEGVNLSEVERLLGFMDEHGLEEFEYERNGLRIRLKKPSASHPGLSRTLSLPEIVVSGAAGSAEAVGDSVASKPGHSAGRQSGSEAAISEDLHVVKSPIVGTFYGSPSPGAADFVNPGDHVEKGQVICIVEAMKLMNEIESDATGEIVKCLVSNGQPIEFGQPLFAIRPA